MAQNETLMTPTPFPPDSEPERLNEESHSSPASRGGSLAPATIETLVRFDEATTSELAAIEEDAQSAAVLRKLRSADAYLESGQMMTAPKTSDMPAEQLFAFGQGELNAQEADVVREHLEESPQEKQWVDALRASPPPATLTWDAIDDDEGAHETTPVLAGPGSRAASKGLPGWIAWTPLAAAALILAMAIGGSGPRSVLDGGLPHSPVTRSAAAEGLLFPRGRVIAATPGIPTYASQPLFEVTPVDGATQYHFVLRDVSAQSAFSQGTVVWESRSASHQATAMALSAGSYVWSASAKVHNIERDLGTLSFTVMPAAAVERALVVRAATVQRDKTPSMLRDDIRRLHASGFLTDAREKARSLPAGKDRDEYLASPSGR